MKEATEILIAIGWLFGALVVWPTMRFWIRSEANQVNWLRWQFSFHIVALIAAFCLVQYSYFTGNKDWLHSMVLPYFVGAISWLAALVILFSFRFSRQSSSCNTMDNNGL